MNYDLAKKLKDAGFPNLAEGKGNRYIYPEESYLGLSRSQACFVPTLSELIEACGEGFSMLTKTTNGWAIQEFDEVAFTGGFNILSEGKTPEEAVANLWLKLNKK